MKQTQVSIVKEELQHNGMVSRNWALGKHISRLAAIIDILRKDGWEIKTKKVNGDYVYRVVREKEPEKAQYRVVTTEFGQQIKIKL